MNKKLIWSLIVIIIVVVLVAVIAAQSKKTADKRVPPVAGEPIRIGADLSLSGIAAQDGEAIKDGLELARADLKAKGVNVDIVYQDDKTEPKDTVSAIQALNAQGVQAIIGPTWSYLADAGVPVATQLGLVTVMPANTSEYVSAHSPYAFFTTAKVATLIAPLSAWLKQSGKKNIAILRNQGLWYEVIEKDVEIAAQQAGVKVVFKDDFAFGTSDGVMGTIVAKAKAANPDVIFTEVDDDRGIVSFFNKTNQLGIKADIVSVTTALGRQLAGGHIKPTPGATISIVIPKTSAAFNAKYEAAYGKVAGPYADRAYDSLMLLVDAIQNRKDLPLNVYLSTKTDYQGFVGRYKFDQNGDITSGEWEVKELK